MWNCILIVMERIPNALDFVRASNAELEEN